MDLQQELQKALSFHRNGDLINAEKRYQSMLTRAPRNFDGNYLLGLVYLQTGKFSQAKKQFRRAVKINPRAPQPFNDLGNALLELDQPSEALINYDNAISLDPTFAEAFNNRGSALVALRRFEEAIESFDRAIAARPDYAMAYYNRGNSFRQLERFDDALANYERAIAINPSYFEAHHNRGNTLMDTGRPDAALAAFDVATSINPSSATAFCNRARALAALRRFGDAVAACERALIVSEDMPEAWVIRGDALRDLQRHNDSLAAFDRALAISPKMAAALFGRALALRNLKRHQDAISSFEELLLVAPDSSYSLGDLAHEKMITCDWAGLAELKQSIDAGVRAGKRSIMPWVYQTLSHSVHDLRRSAEIYINAKIRGERILLCDNVKYHHNKIRIGYMCGEFREHPVSMLMVEVFERHDKTQFELFAFDNGGSDGSEIRRRIDAAFDHMVNIGGLSDAEAALEIKRREIDILIDLNGYSGAAREGILSRRPAPIQVNYLAFPGTMGADFMDYIIADNCVIPQFQESGYLERVIRLPDAYLCNDTKRTVAALTPTRAEAHLPETGVVFCCFNNSYKITPEIFGIWVRLLKTLEGSALWLRADNSDVLRNLRNEAERNGVSPERLVFAERVNMAEHLARHRLADLFLDTLPYNAHTTAIDALWAGLPVLTCLGSTFPGRAAASLLQAAGMPELITHSLEAYEKRALQLARETEQLGALKAKLARNRETCSLFNTERFVRYIEVAYSKMWQRHQRGEPPTSLSVASP